VDEANLRKHPPEIVLSTPEERALALALLRFPEAIEAAVAEYLPHMITGYLWELCKAFSKFFEACPVLKADNDTLKQSRLALVDLVGRTIHTALGLLGIKTVERM
jgi:arginyl-tRNA synthetase